jgi:hypothetical protein
MSYVITFISKHYNLINYFFLSDSYDFENKPSIIYFYCVSDHSVISHDNYYSYPIFYSQG